MMMYPLLFLDSLDGTAAASCAAHTEFFHLFLFDKVCKDTSVYGWTEYDFSDATLLCLPPHKDAWEYKDCKRMLAFHPSLAGSYSFFRYGRQEALHLSLREMRIINRMFDGIGEELQWGIDSYTHTILMDRIRLLLHYVTRFYERQFIVRHDIGREIVKTVDQHVSRFFLSGLARLESLPTSNQYSQALGLSPSYLNDLMRHETGKDVAAFVRHKQIDLARELLSKGDKCSGEVAELLGFPTETAFCRMLEKLKPNQATGKQVHPN